MKMQNSFLFVPGDRPERFGKAFQSGAHRVILDLEDAVAPEHKAVARSAVRAFLASEKDCVVRINGVDSAWFASDLEMLRDMQPAAVMLPKAESCEMVAELVAGVGESVPVIALIETAQGLASCRTLLRSPQVMRLAFGSVDFMSDLDILDDDQGLLLARSELVLASRLAGRAGPIDGVTLALDDDAMLEADVARARQLGFSGKLCIHPRQIPIVNAGFLPDPAEVEWARRVLEASSAPGSAGAIRVDGKLVDRPVIERAARLVAASRAPGGGG